MELYERLEALPLHLDATESKIALVLNTRLPSGITVRDVWLNRDSFVVECDGVFSVLDMMDIADVLHTNLRLESDGHRQRASMWFLVYDHRVELRRDFDLPESEESDDA